MTPSLPEKILAIDARLYDAKISHAFGGALALAYYAEPRVTVDIDLNLFIPTDEFKRLSDSIKPLGVSCKVDLDYLNSHGQCRLWWEKTPIDLFFSYDEFHDAMRKQLRMVPFGTDSRIPILSPEHLTVCKVVFNRPKDWLDIEQILAFVEPLDYEEIKQWLIRVLDTKDPRIEKLRKLRKSLKQNN